MNIRKKDTLPNNVERGVLLKDWPLDHGVYACPTLTCHVGIKSNTLCLPLSREHETTSDNYSVAKPLSYLLPLLSHPNCDELIWYFT